MALYKKCWSIWEDLTTPPPPSGAVCGHPVGPGHLCALLQRLPLRRPGQGRRPHVRGVADLDWHPLNTRGGQLALNLI